MRPHEIAAGHLADADGLTLLLPRSRYEAPFLISGNSPHAIFLEGSHQFLAFECKDNTTFKGLLIPNIEIELDETSVFDPEDEWPVAGCVTRRGSVLNFHAKRENAFAGRGLLEIPVLNNLPSCQLAVGFRRWIIVIGAAHDRRVLFTVEPSSR